MDLSNLQQELLERKNAFDTAANSGASHSQLNSIYKEIKFLSHHVSVNLNPSLWFALNGANSYP